MGIKHIKTAVTPDNESSCVGTDDWNDCHTITCDINMLENNISNIGSLTFLNLAGNSQNVLTTSADNLDYILGTGSESLLSIRPDRTVFNRDGQNQVLFQIQSGEDRAGFALGTVNFIGKDSLGVQKSYAKFLAIIANPADPNPTGRIRFDVLQAGGAGTPTQYFELHGGSQTIKLYKTTDLLGNNLNNFGQLQANALTDAIVFSPADTAERIQSDADSQVNIYANNVERFTINANGPQAPSFTDCSRPCPMCVTAGTYIFNTTDGGLNVSDGTNWRGPSACGGWANT